MYSWRKLVALSFIVYLQNDYPNVLATIWTWQGLNLCINLYWTILLLTLLVIWYIAITGTNGAYLSTLLHLPSWYVRWHEHLGRSNLINLISTWQKAEQLVCTSISHGITCKWEDVHIWTQLYVDLIVM